LSGIPGRTKPGSTAIQNPSTIHSLHFALFVLSAAKGLSEAVAGERTEEGDGTAVGTLAGARSPMGGCTTVDWLHGEVLPSHILTD
jgi:hypothetical protein